MGGSPGGRKESGTAERLTLTCLHYDGLSMLVYTHTQIYMCMYIYIYFFLMKLG